MTDFEVDLTNCDKEPIHLLGAVQSFGFLIEVSRVSGRVIRVSRNSDAWLGREPDDLLGQPLEEVLSVETLRTIHGHLSDARPGDTVARIFGVTIGEDRLVCDVAVHGIGETIVIECEVSDKDEGINSAAVVRGMISRLQQGADMPAFYDLAAREMQELTGFDRVMVYRFAEDGSGEVVAEAANPGVDSYLGLHYPASDIPRQARILYEKNWLRIIPDVNAEPVAIVPARDGDGRPIDLSLSILRSVSPIHIEYLKNMGVQASMSVSILDQGKLWGLFACHHYAPHPVTFARRTAAELFGQMFSMLMENRERQSEAAYEEQSRKLHNRIVSEMASEATEIDSIVVHLSAFSEMLACDGVGVFCNQRSTVAGLTPDEEQFGDLVAFLTEKQIDAVAAFYEIGAVYPPGRAFADRAAGMLVVPLSRPPRDYLVFFRAELVRTVDWAGNPQKPVDIGEHGERLTPRKSFEIWKETRARPVETLARRRSAHCRGPACQPSRSDPAPIRDHLERAPQIRRAAGPADR